MLAFSKPVQFFTVVPVAGIVQPEQIPVGRVGEIEGVTRTFGIHIPSGFECLAVVG